MTGEKDCGCEDVLHCSECGDLTFKGDAIVRCLECADAAAFHANAAIAAVREETLAAAKARAGAASIHVKGHTPMADGTCLHIWRNRTMHSVRSCPVAGAWLLGKRAAIEAIG